MSGTFYEQRLRSLLNADVTELIAFFKSKGILQSVMKCRHCEEEMIWTQRRASLDKYVWKCQTKTCSKYKTNLSIRKRKHWN